MKRIAFCGDIYGSDGCNGKGMIWIREEVVQWHVSFDSGFIAYCYSNKCDEWWHQGAVSIRKTVLPGMAIPMLKIRRPNGRLIFNMEIAIRR